MFSGGDYEEVRRWLSNFAASHVKRESPRIEVIVEAEGAREGRSYGLRLRLGEALAPPAGQPPVEIAFDEAAARRGRLDWCQALATRLRELGRGLLAAHGTGRLSA
jgi:hypothetical protein